MNYCTLEEAWGTNQTTEHFSNKNKNKNKNKTENFENYQKVEYQNSELYNPYNENVYGPNKPLKRTDNSHRFDFSRGITKLPNTNGKKKRINLPPINLENDDNSSEVNQEINEEINEEVNQDDINLNEEEDTVKSNNHINNKLDYIISQFESKENLDTYSDSSNINDLLLFIFTGIFFIFILDIFVKIGKKI